MAKFSEERRGQVLKAGLQILKTNGGEMPVRDLIEEIDKVIKFNDYEKEVYQKTGYVRWQSIFYFMSIGLIKAGWIRKKKGIWYLTEEGAAAIKLDPITLKRTLDKKYEEWQNSQPESISSVQEESEQRIVSTTSFEQAQSSARNVIEEFVKRLEAYPFQDLVAALLRGMGYYTPFIAPKGKDGGFDILAYKDPFGSTGPRMKVQVKSGDQKVTEKTVRELSSLLNKPDEVGLIVSVGGFTSDAEREIRRSQKHIEKVDLEDFINLWEEYYDKLKEEDKALMPIRKIAFLAPPVD